MLGAGLSDAAGARTLVPEPDCATVPELLTLWADGAYRGSLQDWVAEEMGFWIEIVPKRPDQQGFQILPKRWTQERTFAWLMRYRRLRSDYETKAKSSTAWI